MIERLNGIIHELASLIRHPDVCFYHILVAERGRGDRIIAEAGGLGIRDIWNNCV
ncbi:hypothetical protein ACFLVB_00355 [Chloroflexota bacterium]